MVYRRNRRRDALTAPGHGASVVENLAYIERVRERATSRRTNGTLTGTERQVAERREVALAEMGERFDALRAMPITDLVPEFVIDIDGHGVPQVRRAESESPPQS